MVPVSDQDRVEFYTGKLGFTVSADVPFGNGERWVEVAPRRAASPLRWCRRRANTRRGA